MRDTDYWHKPLINQLKNAWPQDSSVRPSTLCDVELGLSALRYFLPNESAQALWVLLTGYPLLESSEPTWNEEKQQTLATLRHLLPFFRSSEPWKRALQQYRKIPEHLRGYDVDQRAERFEQRKPMLAPQRWKLYQQTLQKPLPYVCTNVRWAPPGDYWFINGRHRESVTIPSDLPVPPKPTAHQLETNKQKQSCQLTLAELYDTAAWMDSQLKAIGVSADWAARIKRVSFNLFNQERTKLIAHDTLTIDGIAHLVGMVGSGKSTLMDIATVCLARHGLHITIVVGDVTSALERAELFRRLGLSATPVLGRSNRERQLKQLHRSTAINKQNEFLGLTHQGYTWLSTACALDGLRDSAKPLPIHARPCINLYPADQEDAKHPLACPFYSSCASQQSQRDLVESQIWIATPPSLVFTRVAPQINREQVRFAELVIKHSDLIIVDEADRVQVQLDSIFSPAQNLISRSADAWLSRLDQIVTQQINREGRAQLSDERVAHWLQAHDTVQLAANRLYAMLLQSKALQQEIERDYFTGWLIFERLARELAQYSSEKPNNRQSYEQLMQIFDQCTDDPLGDLVDHALADLALRNLTLTNPERLHKDLEQWIIDRDLHTKPTEQRTKKLAELLEFALAAAVLSNRLDMVIHDWRMVEVPLQLQDAGSPLFHRPPDDYGPEVPAAPMGNVLAFQYIRNNDEHGGAGDLRFFRCKGVGRYLLLNLHTRFAVDRQAGPNVLLLSATSWSGSAPGYDIQIPVTGVLGVPQEEVDAIHQSIFRDEPVIDKYGQRIRISGLRGQERFDALRRMLTELARKSSGAGLSRLERIRAQLPPERQRILLVVGSYEEALFVRTSLEQIRADWSGQVVHLVADDAQLESEWRTSDLGLQRGMVHQFAQTSAWILVAPLLAIERGHNILNRSQQAAIGAALFLIRPHLRPDDIGFAIHSINRWAVEQIGLFNQNGVPSSENRTLLQQAFTFRRNAFKQWRHLVQMPLRYSTLPEQEHVAVTWGHLVSMWQVIGRLVRGGVPARVYFCDAAFSPQSPNPDQELSQKISLLLSMHEVLHPYFTEQSKKPAEDCALAQMLYSPLYQALNTMIGGK